MDQLPQGFQLDEPRSAPETSPPAGFVLDAPEPAAAAPLLPEASAPPKGFVLDGAAPTNPTPTFPPTLDKPGREAASAGGDAGAAPPPASPEDHWAVTRGLVSGLLKQNPELTGHALEGFSQLVPETIGGPLKGAAQKLKDLATLSPQEYDPQAGSFFTSLAGGLGPTLTWAGETFGSGLASMAPSIGAGLVGAGVGGGAGGAIGGPPGAAIGATGGAIGGAASASFVLNYGEVYKALLEEKIDAKLAAQYAGYAALPMALLDTASVGPLLARMGGLKEIKAEAARGIARRIANEGAKGATRESVTEAAQEAIKVAAVSLAADKPFWSIDNVDAIVGSGVGGGLVGGGVGGATGIKRDRLAGRDPTLDEINAALAKLPGGEALIKPPGAETQSEKVQSLSASQDKWYYSQVARVAEEKLPNSGTAEQMLATLENAPGVKREEVAALGLPEWLATVKGPITKADMVAHIEENAVRVETVDTQDLPASMFERIRFTEFASDTFMDQYGDIGVRRNADNTWSVVRALRTGEPERGIADAWPNQTAYRDRPQAELSAQQLADSTIRQNEGQGTRFNSWTLPGGENYREVKLTLPNNSPTLGGIKDRAEYDKALAAATARPVYTSPHFDEPNIVAHFRAKDRFDAEGKRGLGVEEIQSDWHQTGRQRGYRNETRISELRRQIAEADTARDYQRGVELGNELNRLESVLEGVPDAPFKTSWPELALKRILRMAADEGYERVYIMPGKEQARRYGQTGAEARGQIEFYDNIVPRLMEKWAKKLGGKVGVTNITIQGEQVGNPQELSVRYIDVTPEMQTKISRGLPLFSLKGPSTSGPIQVVEEFSLNRAPPTPESKALRAAAQQVAIPVGQIAKRMGITVPISIQLVSSNRIMGQLETFRARDTGNITAFRIDLSVTAHKTAEEMYATVAHEMGHAIHRSYFDKASNLTKLRIGLEYSKWKEAQGPNPNFGALLKTRDNFITDSYNSRTYPQNIRLNDLVPEQRIYWLSFDEWMAEQAAKWMTTAEKPLSVVDKFFSALGRKLRELYQFWSLRFGDIGKPEKFVAEWLDSLMTETDVQSFEVVSALENRTREINRSAMRAEGVPEFPAEPFTGATILPRELLQSMQGPQVQAGLASAAAADRFNKFYHYMLSMVQVAARNTHIAPLQRYRELWQIKQLERTQIMDGALTTLKGWRKLNGVQQDAVAGLIDDYMNLEFLTPAEKAAGVSRRPDAAELQALAAKHKVSNQGLAVFAQVVLDFDGMLTRYGDILVQAANKITDPIAQAVRLQAIGTQIANLRKQPYFPAMRFGDLTLTIRNAANAVIHFETFETNKKRKSAERLLTGRLQPGERIELGILPKDAGPLMGMPSGLLDLIDDKLSLSAQQKGMLEQLRFEMAPAQSFRHRFQNKARTPGYSSDFMRAYANYFFHGSNYFTNVKYIDQLREQVKEVRDSSRQMYDGTKRGMIANFLSDHLAYMMDPKPDFAALRGMAFLWFLGYSPAAAAVNLTQLLIGSGPFLSSQFGDLKSAAALAKAGAKVSSYYRKANLAASTDREIRAIGEGVKEGVITEAMAPELAAISEGRNLQKGFGGNLLEKGWQRFSEGASFMFEMTEQMNRRITFRAAFQLAIDNPAAPYVAASVAKHRLQFDRLKAAGWTDTDAAAFVVAKDVVEATQYIYQPYAQPRFMRGKLRTVFVFKTFLQNTLFMLWNYPSAAVRSVLVMGAIAGIMGVPGADDLKGVLKALAWQLFGRDFDIEDEARKAILALAGGAVPPDLLLHGMSRYGFNIPAVMSHLGAGNNSTQRGPDGRLLNLEFDLSKSIGLGQVSPIDFGKALGPGATKDSSRAMADTTQRASGAVFGLGFNMWKTMNDPSPYNEIKRWEKIMPRELASMSKAYRAMSEGMEKDQKGNAVVRYDVTDPRQMMEVIGLSMGFQPKRLSAQWDKRIAQMEAEQFWDIRRTGLINQAWSAKGDKENYEQVLGAIRKFNTDLPEEARGRAITADTLRRSFETRARSNNATESGVPRVRGNIPIAREIQRLYPEADVDVRKTR